MTITINLPPTPPKSPPSLRTPSTMGLTPPKPCVYCSPSNPHVEPPSPPNPASDRGVIPLIGSPNKNAPSPPGHADWQVEDILPETAMKLLCRSVDSLAKATGNIPPTPPRSRPTSPCSTPPRPGHRRTNSRPATPISPQDLQKHSEGGRNFKIESPEACMSEPAAGREVGANAEPVHKQQAAISRKFFSKRAPPIALEAYVSRIQRFCPMSTAVWLAAGCYIHKLAIEEKIVPVTDRTVHRLVLASLRVAMKALEDIRYPQARFAGVGGVSEEELRMLEISVCYLTNFDLQVDNRMLYEKMILLQQAASQAQWVSRSTPSTFQPRLPIRTNIESRIIPDGIVA